MRIPAPAQSAAAAGARSPHYVPASTKSVAITVFKVGGSSVTFTPEVTNLTPGTAPCGSVSGGNYTCTIPATLPVGTDVTQITTYDAANAGGNVLSQQVSSLAVVAGAANTFGHSTPITLDAAPGVVSVTASTGATGTYPSFTENGTGTDTFAVSVVDGHGTAFGSQPGQPVIAHAAATGTGASASVSGGTLTLTPPSSGSSSNVVVDADPLGTQDVTTTLSSSPGAGATSFTVSSASGIYVGANLVLDYEAFSGSTLLQESVLVNNVSGTTITIASGLAHAHSSGAGVRHYSDNLSPSSAPFTLTIAQTLIAPVGVNDSTGASKALVYNTSFALQTGSLTSSTATYSYARFDTADQLFIADQNLERVYRAQYTLGTGFAGVTTYTGIPNQGGNFGFDVSSGGAVAAENSAGASPQLTFYAAGSTSAGTFSTASLPPATWQTVTEFLYPTAAVLADSSGNAFGYAYSVFNVNGSAHDQIVVTNGTSEQDVNSSGIASVFNSDPTSGVLTWNVGRQSVIYGNSHTGAGNAYAILEFPRSGTTGATLTTSPTTVGSLSGAPVSVAASRDGSYVAVAWSNAAGSTSVTLFHNGGSGWSTGATLSTTFPNFTAIHFVPSGNLIVSDSNGTYASLFQFTNAGAQVGSTYSAEGDFGGSFLVNDVAVSY